MLNQVVFQNRWQAGALLSEKLTAYQGGSVILLGLSRGGVVVAASVANTRKATCDVLVVKKLASFQNREFALGAVAPEGIVVLHHGNSKGYIRTQISQLNDQIRYKTRLYRKKKKPIEVKGKTVILIDDGAATGATMEAAVLWARKKRAGEIVVALPVASAEAADLLRKKADELIVLHEDPHLQAVGAYYESFHEISDEEVVKLLQ